MSSNIRVNRICQYCQKEFIAKTTKTKYCGDVCAKRAYKDRKRKEKIEASNEQTKKSKTKSIEEIQAKDFLTIAEACELLSVSRWTIWRAIKRNELNAGKIGRRVILRRSDIESLFMQ
ncbi:MAG: helix-turn-helix domain-containing protein [Aureispira sp.]|nr:helix-turn-helix domain-containing protein [Aureispira sp.]